MTTKRRTGEIDETSDLDRFLPQEEPTPVRRVVVRRSAGSGSHPRESSASGAHPRESSASGSHPRESSASGSHPRESSASGSYPSGMPHSTVQGYRVNTQTPHPGGQSVVYPPPMLPPNMPQQELAGFRMSLPGLIMLVLALLTVGAVMAVVIVKLVVPQAPKTIVLPGNTSQGSTVVMPMPMPQQPVPAVASPSSAHQPAAAPGRARPARPGGKQRVAGEGEDEAKVGGGQAKLGQVEEESEQEEEAAEPKAKAAEPEKKPAKQEGWPDPFSQE